VAAGDVHLGYVNQGHITAQGSIYVEQSIVHSVCHAKEAVQCKIGNIIGGSITARKTIEARDIGNRLSTTTNISFELTNDYFEQRETAIEKRKSLQERLEQLTTIGDKLKHSGVLNNPRIAEMLKKQTHSLVQTKADLAKVNNQIHILEQRLAEIEQPKLIVRQTLFPQVIVAFDKYKRNFQTEYRYIYVTIEGNEIMTHSK